MGKKKVIGEEDIENMVLPVANDILGMALTMMGFDRILVNREDGPRTPLYNPMQVD